jgi:hypothetical protein
MSACRAATSSCSASPSPAPGCAPTTGSSAIGSTRSTRRCSRARPELAFETRRWQRGFRNGTNDTRLVGNGTFLNNFEIAPAIGMDRFILLQDRAKRRKYGLPAEQRPAKLEDLSANPALLFRRRLVDGRHHGDDRRRPDSDRARQEGVGREVRNGRRTARFVSTAPILNFFSIQSADYRVAPQPQRHRPVGLLSPRPRLERRPRC